MLQNGCDYAGNDSPLNRPFANHGGCDGQIVTFRYVRTKIRIPGFICHHVIPNQVTDATAFGIFFGTMKSLGFSTDDFCANGMHLPCDEKTAAMTARPIHRGSHPQYNKLVAQHIAEIQKLPPVEAFIALNTLIGNLRSGLRFSSLGDLGFIDDSAKTSLARNLETIGILGAARIRVSRLP
jgi:A nuclease family of the HNH/ENDO VII superfamily with conserved AHH